jgi:hypothetical protein
MDYLTKAINYTGPVEIKTGWSFMLKRVETGPLPKSLLR